MGYPSVSQFDVQFIKRTLTNLDCKVENVYTHLLNSLLGLIVLPRQWTIQGKKEMGFFNLPIVSIPDLRFLLGTAIVDEEYTRELELKKLDFRYKKFDEITIGEIMDRLRHCIAHQSIRPTSNGESWEGIIFRNYSTEARAAEWKDNFDMQLYVTMAELKTFAIYISNAYLKEQ